MSAPDPGRWRRFERAVAKHLTDALDVRVVSSRSVSGGRQDEAGDLFSYDRDELCRHVYGWTLELKDVERPSVPKWLEQAQKASDGSGLYAVIHKNRGRPTREDRVWVPRGMLRAWLSLSDPWDGSDAEPVSLSLDAFTVVIA